MAAAWTADRKEITLAVVNPNRDSKVLEFKLDRIKPQAQGTKWTIAGDDPKVRNDEKNQRIKIVEGPAQWQNRLSLAPLSITLLRFPVE